MASRTLTIDGQVLTINEHESVCLTLLPSGCLMRTFVAGRTRRIQFGTHDLEYTKGSVVPRKLFGYEGSTTLPSVSPRANGRKPLPKDELYNPGREDVCSPIVPGEPVCQPDPAVPSVDYSDYGEWKAVHRGRKLLGSSPPAAFDDDLHANLYARLADLVCEEDEPSYTPASPLITPVDPTDFLTEDDDGSSDSDSVSSTETINAVRHNARSLVPCDPYEAEVSAEYDEYWSQGLPQVDNVKIREEDVFQEHCEPYLSEPILAAKREPVHSVLDAPPQRPQILPWMLENSRQALRKMAIQVFQPRPGPHAEAMQKLTANDEELYKRVAALRAPGQPAPLLIGPDDVEAELREAIDSNLSREPLDLLDEDLYYFACQQLRVSSKDVDSVNNVLWNMRQWCIKERPKWNERTKGWQVTKCFDRAICDNPLAKHVTKTLNQSKVLKQLDDAHLFANKGVLRRGFWARTFGEIVGGEGPSDKKLGAPALCVSYCVGPDQECKEMDAENMISLAGMDINQACLPRYHTVIAVPFSNLPPVYFSSSCVHNQYNALRNRLLAKCPEMQPEAFGELMMAAQQMGKRLHYTHPMTPTEVAMLYSGPKRQAYLKARDNLTIRPIEESDAHIEMHSKAEKYDFTKKVRPDMRTICARLSKKYGPRYALLLATFLKPIEHQIYALESWWHGATHTRFIAKGLSPKQRATLLLRKLELFGSWVVLSLDCSRFDMHVREGALMAEHAVYTSVMTDPLFKRLLSYQLVNKGKSLLGVRFKCCGCRMSGDMNTACGNCTLMTLQIIAFCTKYNIPFELFDDGDDCLLIVPPQYVQFVQENMPGYFLSLGHELKFESAPADKLEDITFCQSKLVKTDEGWTFVRNPIKVLSHALVSRDFHTLNQKARYEYVAAIGMCELALNRGVPILSQFGERLKLLGHKPSDKELERVMKNYYGLRRGNVLYSKAVPITPEARRTFALAFGIPEDAQIRAEQHLKTWTPNLTGLESKLPSIEAPWFWYARDTNRSSTPLEYEGV